MCYNIYYTRLTKEGYIFDLGSSFTVIPTASYVTFQWYESIFAPPLISVSWHSSSPSHSLWLPWIAVCTSSHLWGWVLHVLCSTAKFVSAAIHSGRPKQCGGRWTPRLSDYGCGRTLIKSSKKWGNNSHQTVSAFTPYKVKGVRPVWTGPPHMWLVAEKGGGKNGGKWRKVVRAEGGSTCKSWDHIRESRMMVRNTESTTITESNRNRFQKLISR